MRIFSSIEQVRLLFPFPELKDYTTEKFGELLGRRESEQFPCFAISLMWKSTLHSKMNGVEQKKKGNRCDSLEARWLKTYPQIMR